MLKKMTAFADAHQMLPREGLVLAAVSGGADSVALLTALLELSEDRGFTVAAAHYNHRLRGAQSDRDAQFVADLCRQLGVTLYCGGGDVGRFAESSGLGPEAAARRMRYDFLYETARAAGAARIATGHTADDNTETVLLNLTRGAGLRGLGGIPPKRGPVIRPMLTATREDVLAYLRDRNLAWVEDATNSLDIYNRNLLRLRVVPVLRKINPRLSEAVGTAAALLREDDAYITEAARRYIRRHGENGVFDAGRLYRLPRPVSSRVIRLAWQAELTSAHVESVLALCASGNGSSSVSLPGGVVCREYGRVVFSGGSPPSGFEPVSLSPGETVKLPELDLTVCCEKTVLEENIHSSFTTFLFNYDNICGKIIIRPRKTGDKIAIFGRNGTKSLKKLFIEARIPAKSRPRVPVVADDGGVLAVYGIGCDRRAACKPGDTVLKIIFKETGA